jgi:hypothetical protein
LYSCASSFLIWADLSFRGEISLSRMTNYGFKLKQCGQSCRR